MDLGQVVLMLLGVDILIYLIVLVAQVGGLLLLEIMITVLKFCQDQLVVKHHPARLLCSQVIDQLIIQVYVT